ncbi:hypothetical protein [Streptomyces virginiae]|uniref:hypothetical protein n=1 Tax=Streptomyces virginiae TaxID=1961 RepID=UPI0035E0635B
MEYLLVMSVGIGLFIPVEQELTRIVAARAVCGEGAAPVLRKAGLLTAGFLAVVLGALALFAGPIADRLFPGDQALVAVLGAALTGMALCYLPRGVLAGTGRFTAYGSPLAVDGGLRTVRRPAGHAVPDPGRDATRRAHHHTGCACSAATAAPGSYLPPGARRPGPDPLPEQGRHPSGRRHREPAQPPGRPARRPGRPRARVRDLAPRPIPAPRESRNGWTPAAPAGVHPFSVRLFHAHLTRGGPRRQKGVVQFDHSAWRGILFRPIGQVRASYGRLLKLLG